MVTVLDSLNHALRQAMVADERVIIMGEDILDPYGGAFKVTRHLSEIFPKRVITTPISEAGIIGIGTGLALRGFRPVVEIMFGDFLTLIADQVINHAAKFHWMYNGGKSEEELLSVPLIIRTPMGGRRGYGPTHSQTLEKLFLGVPGLHVLAPCTFGDPGKLLETVILNTCDPVLFVENKLQYLLPVQEPILLDEFVITEKLDTLLPGQGEIPFGFQIPSYTLSLRDAPKPVITLVSYGYMAELGRQAALQLAYKNEVFIELIVLTQLSPLNPDPIFESVSRTGRLLTIEEGTRESGWGAEVIARINEAHGQELKVAHRIAALNLPIPASGQLEAAVLPGVEDIIQRSLGLIEN